MNSKEAYGYLEKGKKVYFISLNKDKIYLEIRPDGFLYWTGENYRVYNAHKHNIKTKEEQKEY